MSQKEKTNYFSKLEYFMKYSFQVSKIYNDYDFNGRKLIFTHHECSDALRIKELLKILKSEYNMSKNDIVIIDGTFFSSHF